MNLTSFAIFLGPFSVGEKINFPTKGHSFTIPPQKKQGVQQKERPVHKLGFA